MATPTTGTRTTKPRLWPSAAHCDVDHIPTYEDVVVADLDCRKSKRNTPSALAYEWHQERNNYDLWRELVEGTYRPGRSICFVVKHPKPREVWAADFRDRIVHHLLYNRIGPRFEHSFIANSCACIKGRGTLYAVRRLEHDVRSITQNWSRRAYYLKLDLANFFVSIPKPILMQQLAAKIQEPFWLQLAETILMHDPRLDYEFRGDPSTIELVPPHKRLGNQPADRGLPIGNLSSQFFANVFLNTLDQFVKHQLRTKHYVRYVDDFVLLHESTAYLEEARRQIEAFLPERLGVRLNPRKTILQPVDRGVDFVGQIIKPWHTTTRNRTVRAAVRRIDTMPTEDVFESANSYFGLLRQANHSHEDRAALANAVRRRGFTVNHQFTQTYRSASA